MALILAPMAGVTDYAFRTIAGEWGADVTVTEMVSSRALCYGDQKTFRIMRPNPGTICGVQIFGNSPDMMAKAAGIVYSKTACDFIDINMGCPMPKVAAHGDGAGLMKTPELAYDIVRAVKETVPVPLCAKMRIGWDEQHKNHVSFAKKLEAAGIDCIAVHGRTRSQLYGGTADYNAIREVRDAVSVKVIANGDVRDAESLDKIMNVTGLSDVMIGRAAMGNPFLFAKLQAHLKGKTMRSPDIQTILETAEKQLMISVEEKGEHIACLEARKYLCWYLKGLPHTSRFRKQFSSISSLKEISAVFQEISDEM